MAKAAAKVPSPLIIANDMQFGGWKLYTLSAAAELDVFTRIDAGKRTAAEIAADAGANERAMRRLLDAVVGLGYLTRKGEKYGLTPHAATYLVRGKELYNEEL